MGFEVDFLPVGSGEKSGDAIAIRHWSDSATPPQILVIDGGTQESGQQLVEHIKGYYKSTSIDFAILTHPDADHASGLRVVLEQLHVSTLLMHRPWAHSQRIAGLWQDGRFIQTRLVQRLREAMETAHEVEQIAIRRGVTVHEPFAGDRAADDSFVILGPSREYYDALLPAFLDLPPAPLQDSLLKGLIPPTATPRTSIADYLASIPPYDPGSLSDLLPPPAPSRQRGPSLRDLLQSATPRQLLDDDAITSARNSSSVILLLRVGGKMLLFTGDAGIEALKKAADFAAATGTPLDDIDFLDVPHHGSRRNLGPSVLQRLRARVAFISAAGKSDPKHPSKRIVNALIDCGTKVYATQGSSLRHHFEAPDRGWSPATPLAKSSSVEE